MYAFILKATNTFMIGCHHNLQAACTLCQAQDLEGDVCCKRNLLRQHWLPSLEGICRRSLVKFKWKGLQVPYESLQSNFFRQAAEKTKSREWWHVRAGPLPLVMLWRLTEGLDMPSGGRGGGQVSWRTDFFFWRQ